MIYRKPRAEEEVSYEQLAQHPLQSRAWGKFRETTGLAVERLIGFEDTQKVAQMQVTFHPLPKIPYTVGYYPKGRWPDEVSLQALKELGQQHKAIFVKLEPDVSKPPHNQADLDGFRDFLLQNGCEKGRALFTPYTFLIDLNSSEEELMAGMKNKTRYNIRVAQKHGVQVVEDSSDDGFQDYLKLLRMTTKRQKFYAHTEAYQKNMWKIMNGAGIARILKATYQGETVVAWILFYYKNKLYYPYGASSRKHKKVMASNLVMWEAMRLGKQLGCKSFDLWGSLGPNPDQNDPWFGFHKFKEGYGGVLAEFAGTYDLVVDSNLYQFYRLVDRYRWKWLRLKSNIPFVS